MRRYRFTQSAAKAFDKQIDYLISVDALQAARALEKRLHAFISQTLCNFPHAGTHVAERDIYECWVPGTRIVVWYKVYEAEIIVAMIWHTSQNRNDGEDEPQ
jgi:plasmid stabilization system protein ParE